MKKRYLNTQRQRGGRREKGNYIENSRGLLHSLDRYDQQGGRPTEKLGRRTYLLASIVVNNFSPCSSRAAV